MNKKLKLFAHKISRVFLHLSLKAPFRRTGINLKEYPYRDGRRRTKSLDIGSGPDPKNPFEAEEIFGVDIRSWDINASVKCCFLGAEPIPFDDEYFDFITSYDVLEHIPRVNIDRSALHYYPFIFAMNEIFRVMKVDGLFYMESPCFPFAESFQDPTHVNIMTEDTMRLYFTGKCWARIYGFEGSFELLDEGWRGGHYFCLVRKTLKQKISGVNTSQSN